MMNLYPILTPHLDEMAPVSPFSKDSTLTIATMALHVALDRKNTDEFGNLEDYHLTAPDLFRIRGAIYAYLSIYWSDVISQFKIKYPMDQKQLDRLSKQVAKLRSLYYAWSERETSPNDAYHELNVHGRIIDLLEKDRLTLRTVIDIQPGFLTAYELRLDELIIVEMTKPYREIMAAVASPFNPDYTLDLVIEALVAAVKSLDIPLFPDQDDYALNFQNLLVIRTKLYEVIVDHYTKALSQLKDDQLRDPDNKRKFLSHTKTIRDMYLMITRLEPTLQDDIVDDFPLHPRTKKLLAEGRLTLRQWLDIQPATLAPYEIETHEIEDRSW